MKRHRGHHKLRGCVLQASSSEFRENELVAFELDSKPWKLQFTRANRLGEAKGQAGQPTSLHLPPQNKTQALKHS